MPNSAVPSFQNPDAYEQVMGRWSRRLAPLLIRFGGLSDDDRVLDVGCGTGSLAFTVAEIANVLRLADTASQNLRSVRLCCSVHGLVEGLCRRNPARRLPTHLRRHHANALIPTLIRLLRMVPRGLALGGMRGRLTSRRSVGIPSNRLCAEVWAVP